MEKIAVLGSGVGALSAVYAITSQPGWQEKYDITVYQMGWRSGGKGASGRGLCERIEEHGLHIWMGFYDNAFACMKQCYKEMGRPPGTPLAEWTDAFKKHDLVGTAENVNGAWDIWNIVWPENDQVPGTPPVKLHTTWDYALFVAEKLLILAVEFAKEGTQTWHVPAADADKLQEIIKSRDLEQSPNDKTLGERGIRAIFDHLKDTAQHVEMTVEHLETMHLLIEITDGWFSEDVLPEILADDRLRHIFLLIDLGLAMLKGFISEGVLWSREGISGLDKYDLREFLAKYGAHPTTVNSGQIQAVYDLVFAYENGEVDRPALSAGVAIRGTFRMAFTYKGSIFWEMQAGMGDTVFTPLYQVLKKRGVKFRFFAKVLEVAPAEGGGTIDRIRIEQQADMANGDPYSYDPLVNVPTVGSNGEIGPLLCWPSEPNYSQIDPAQAHDLQANKINLESFWSPWKGREFTLEKGKDFDLVILGISLGALPYVAPRLGDYSPKWKAMIDNIGTVRTMAMQLWFTTSSEEMGNRPGDVVAGYEQYLNTWADMSHLIVREAWPPQCNTKAVAYMCGPMPGGIPEPGNPQVPSIELAKGTGMMTEWAAANTGFLWPGIRLSTDPRTFDHSKLVVPPGSDPGQRFQNQYFRVNIDPTERYNLSLPGTTKYRIWPGETGYDNLFAAGDWTRSTIDAGCVEAAVISGLKASQAITGSPLDSEIYGFEHA